jgi:nucleoside-diphosphate kinase
MSEGPVVVMVLERENAIAGLREVMGATDPAKADEGTIRKEFAENVERNIIHGSDSPESAAFEISYYFNALEITSA